MKFEKPITNKQKQSLEGITAGEAHRLFDSWFEEEHTEAYHQYEGSYDTRYYLSINGDRWTAVVEYSRRTE